MIHPSLIDSARNIKKEFDDIQKELFSYQKDVETLSQDFLEGSKQVGQIEKRIKETNMTETEIKENMMKVLNDLEDKYTLLLKKVTEFNARMEDLKKQELDLYNIIKKKYPSLSDEEIKKQIHENI